MMTLGIVLAGALHAAAVPEKLEKLPYERMVEIVKVEAGPASGAQRRRTLEITFNLAPDLPRGIRVHFELQRQAQAVGEPLLFTLENETRKGIKVAWTPRERLTTDKYMLITRIPLADQSPEVRKVLSSKTTRFPPDFDPWPFAHADQEFVVGTPEDQAAELQEMKKFVDAHVNKFLALNNEGVEELEKAQGKLDQEALKKRLNDWMKRMAEAQKEVNEFVVTEPGLFARFQHLHQELADLGRMIAKRITRTDLAALLKRNNLPAQSLLLPPVAGFDPNYRHRALPVDIEKRCDQIETLLNPGGKEEPEAGEAAAGTEEGQEKPSAKDEKDPKEAEEEKKTPPEDPKAKDSPPGKKAAAGKPSKPVKGGKKTDVKKSSDKKSSP